MVLLAKEALELLEEQLIHCRNYNQYLQVSLKFLKPIRSEIRRSDLLELLARKYLNCSATTLRINAMQEPNLTRQQISEWRADLIALKEAYPWQYCLGYTGFYGLEIKVKPGVLIPRPDSEVLVEEVNALILKNATYKILEIGVGSGALLTAIGVTNRDKDITLYGTDINIAALELSALNLKEHQVDAKLFKADLYPRSIDSITTINTTNSFDLIYSNPPYIAEAERKDLPYSVLAYEPESALFAAEDGLNMYRRILGTALLHLKADGYLLFEHGATQKQALLNLIESINLKLTKGSYSQGYKWQLVKQRQDYRGLDRVLVLRKAAVCYNLNSEE